VHLYLAEASPGGMQGWLAAIDTINSLQRSTVIAGHKRNGAEDGPDNIDKTAATCRTSMPPRSAGNAQDLYK
jgi:hypothetical protein